MRKLGIDYGEVRTGLAITDELNLTVQGLETINSNGNDKIILKRLDELIELYDIDTFVVGNPINLKGEKTIRTEKTEKFINKLKCKYNKIKIELIDERLTTVSAQKEMILLDINKNKKKKIVDTIAAMYILEIYLNKIKK